MDTASPRIALMASRKVSGEFLLLTIRAVTLADDGSPRNIRCDDAYGEGLPYAGLTITAQGDRNDDRTYAYAWRFGIAPDTETMVTSTVLAVIPTLRKVEKALTRDTERYGAPASFGAYVARIATALGVSVIVGQERSNSVHGWYTDMDWRSYSAGDAVNVIDGWLRDHRMVAGVTID